MLKKTRSCTYDFTYHLVFATKYRKVLFTTDAYRNDMKQTLNQIAKSLHVEIQAVEVMPDHVHLVISFPPKEAPSGIVKYFKGRSARVWFKLHPETRKLLYGGHLWSPSYYMSTAGNVSKEIILQYVKSQIKDSVSRPNL